jgi:hypothetical protein
LSRISVVKFLVPVAPSREVNYYPSQRQATSFDREKHCANTATAWQSRPPVAQRFSPIPPDSLPARRAATVSASNPALNNTNSMGPVKR